MSGREGSRVIPRVRSGSSIPLVAVLCVLATQAGCPWLRTPGVLKALNGTSGPADPNAPKIDLATRIARLTKAHLADAYVEPGRVAEWLDALGQKPGPVTDLVSCLVKVRDQPSAGAGQTLRQCYDAFTSRASASLPPVPTSMNPLKTRTNPEVGLELDVERILANTRALGASLAALQQLVGRGPLLATDLESGIAEGTRRAAAYIKARSWRRSVSRPTTAIVMSGGAANGAFSAGLVWRLLEVLESCRGATSGGCPGAGIDLVAGTSTGALISLVVDMASTPGYESRARDVLLDAYTCSVNTRLYCVQSAWVWSLATGDLKGLARFDGIRQMIKSKVPEATETNATERVAVSVDFESGDVYAQSDQDPEDAGDWDHRIDSVMASIVEPVLAEPISEVSHNGGRLRGTFLDGGVRSGLPLLEAVRRGAERVLVINTSGIEPGRQGPPKNAFKILMRTIDLLSGQPRPGEVQQGELAAVERRWIEYNVCTERLLQVPGVSRPDVTSFCERREGFYPPPQGLEAAPPSFMGPAFFQQVASSWRTSWLFRPEVDLPGAEGYAFDPQIMRPLFELGATTFQHRCNEILDVLGIWGSVAHSACLLSDEDVVKKARDAYTPLERCGTGEQVQELRTCE